MAAMAVIVAFMAWFYLWTTATSGHGLLAIGHHQTDYYNLLGSALLHGHLDLYQIKPPAGLLRVADPYSAAQNAPYRNAIFDLSLYHGKLYSYWGPAPLVLYLPWRIVFPGDLPQPLAAAIFCWVGLVFAVALLRFLVRRFAPNTSAWIQALGALVLALSSVTPFLLRRIEIYEVAIAGAYCFSMAALYFLASGTLGERRSGLRMGLGSLCVGLAAGSRPNMGILFLVCIALVGWLHWSRAAVDFRTLRRYAAYLLAPALLCFIALGLYNQARFGSFAEFGNQYQINGLDVRGRGYLASVRWLPPNLWYYLIAPARFVLAFPYVQLPPPPAYPGTLPTGYNGAEITGGVLTNYPLVLLGIVGIGALAVPRFRRALGGLGVIGGAFTLLGLVVVLAVAYLVDGCTERYEVDFTPLLLLGALTFWIAARAALASRLARRALSIVAGAFALFGIGIGTALGFTGYFNALQVQRPATFRGLEGFFAPLPTLAAVLAGHPLITTIDNPQGYFSQPPVKYTTTGPVGSSFWMDLQPTTVKVVSPKSEQAALHATLGRGPNLRRGSRAWVEATTSSSKARVPVTGAKVTLPVKLHSGLNDITLHVVTSRPPPLPTTNPAWGQVVGVANVVVGSAAK